jgi:hypothetical protein
LGSVYNDWVVETGKQPELFLFATFLLTFGFIRTSAHMIRAQVKWWPGNVSVGGTHVHHLVWGILLILAVGYVAIAFAPGPPGRGLLAVLFGIGAGLTLDEFALWLNLEDVYWSHQGRRSIDAVIIAATVTGIVLVGFTAWLDVATKVGDAVLAVVGSFGVLAILIAAVNFAKEKFGIAVIGLVFLPVGLVGAFRLGRPRSLWARLFYREDKKQRARRRFGEPSPAPAPHPAAG